MKDKMLSYIVIALALIQVSLIFSLSARDSKRNAMLTEIIKTSNDMAIKRIQEARDTAKAEYKAEIIIKDYQLLSLDHERQELKNKYRILKNRPPAIQVKAKPFTDGTLQTQAKDFSELGYKAKVMNCYTGVRQ